jgi:hypothetical protein
LYLLFSQGSGERYDTLSSVRRSKVVERHFRLNDKHTIRVSPPQAPSFGF